MCISGASWKVKIFHYSGPTFLYHSYWLEVDTGVALHIVSLMLRLSVSYYLLREKRNTSCILVSSTRSKVKDRPRRLPMSRKMGGNKREYFVCVHVFFVHLCAYTYVCVCEDFLLLHWHRKNSPVWIVWAASKIADKVESLLDYLCISLKCN